MTSYNFTIVDDGVYVVNNLGYQEIIQGLVNITARTPVSAPTSPIICIYRSNADQPLKIRMDEIDKIDGNTAAGTLAGVLAQLNAIFIDAYTAIVAGGGGGGDTVETLVFVVGTPAETVNVTPTASVANGNDITDASLSGKTILAVHVDNIFSEPIDATGYSFSGSTLDFTTSGGVADVNVYVQVKS